MFTEIVVKPFGNRSSESWYDHYQTLVGKSSTWTSKTTSHSTCDVPPDIDMKSGVKRKLKIDVKIGIREVKMLGKDLRLLNVDVSSKDFDKGARFTRILLCLVLFFFAYFSCINGSSEF